MNLEQAKFEISKKVTKLKKLLQIRDFDIIPSEEGSEEYIVFHEYSYPEAFKNDLIFDHFGQLDEWLHLCYLNELDGNKQILLVESIIEHLTFYDYYSSSNYEENLPLLTQSQIDLLNSFIDVQKNAHQQILETLTQKYLSEVGLDKTKIARIIWKGTQLQLAELFSQLKAKNWIDTGKNHAAFYRTLATVFEVPESKSLLENIKDYFTKKKISNHGVFKAIPSNEI